MLPKNAYSSEDEFLAALRDWFAGKNALPPWSRIHAGKHIEDCHRADMPDMQARRHAALARFEKEARDHRSTTEGWEMSKIGNHRVEVQERTEFAWLIEFPETGDAYKNGERIGPVTPIQWYCAVRRGDRLISRTIDAHEAIRFARRVDAEVMIQRLDDNPHGPTKAYACEHGFCFGWQDYGRTSHDQ
jgi:hypothetical protein